MADTDQDRGGDELTREEIDERIELDMGEPRDDVPTAEPGDGGTHDDLGRGAD